MGNFFLFTILICGASGIIAQTAILRELLVSFYGNELTVGVILSNWVILEALGVYAGGILSRKKKNAWVLFIALGVAFSLALPLSVYLCRVFKTALGIPFGQGVGLPAVFFISLLANSAVGVSHGAMFSVGCALYARLTRETASGIGKVYGWETFGAVLGGVILTYCFIPYLNTFQITFVVAAVNLPILLFWQRFVGPRALRYALVCVICVSLGACAAIRPSFLQRASINTQWNAQEVLAYTNSLYGNIVVTRQGGQRTFFYNGIPVITTPYPDIAYVEEFGNLPLLFHESPKDVLVISGGAGGLINEILKYRVHKVDYAELDPSLIRVIKEYSSALIDKELGDERVRTRAVDARTLVSRSRNDYDVIVTGIVKPTDLATNRYFTEEFFSLAKRSLRSGGILAFCLPGSLTYLSSDMADLNFSVLNALKKIFRHVRVIPGDFNLFLASESARIQDASPQVISERILRRSISTKLLVPGYVEYRLDKGRLAWFNRYGLKATTMSNKDLWPFALFQTEVVWNREFSPRFGSLFASLKKFNFKGFLIILWLIMTVLFFALKRKKRGALGLSLTFGIASTGFFGMLMNLVLIFSYQVSFGYVYQKIGILTSVFMMGAASGSIYISRRMKAVTFNIGFFAFLESLIGVFVVLVALLVTSWPGQGNFFSLIYFGLFFITGLLMGLEFPLAGKLYLGGRKEVGETAGLLYCADLAGGWAAGLLAGTLCIPLIGVFNTCMIVVFLKLTGLFLIFLYKTFDKKGDLI